MSAQQEKDDYFKIDVEVHLLASLKYVDYFRNVTFRREHPVHFAKALYGPEGGPGHRRFGKGESVRTFWETSGREGCPTPEDLLALMDKYGVDMACLLPESMMYLSDYSTKWSTNGQVLEACEKYPDRFVFQPNVGPLIKRGVKNAVWELEYLVKERNAKLVKFYPVEDTYINDPELWPFYKKICELDIPVTIHLGTGLLPNVRSKYSMPMLLEDVLIDFPEMKVIGFHFGWPYHHDLNVVAAAYPNVYIGMSCMLNWALSAPRRFAELIGEAISWAGPDKVIWGTDIAYAPELLMANAVEGFGGFQIPEDMQQGYGYTPLTTAVKRKIFGENLAKLLNIEPRRRIKS